MDDQSRRYVVMRNDRLPRRPGILPKYRDGDKHPGYQAVVCPLDILWGITMSYRVMSPYLPSSTLPVHPCAAHTHSSAIKRLNILDISTQYF